MKAGLIDRAEDAFGALEGTPFETEARLALLGLHERSRDWSGAIEIASRLEQAGTGSFAARIAHYHCELAAEAQDHGDSAAADAHLAQAQAAAPQAARPLIQRAQRLALASDAAAALAVYADLRLRDPGSFVRVAADYAACAQHADQADAAREVLGAMFQRQPGLDLLRALALLEGGAPGGSPRLAALLRDQPSLSAAIELLDVPCAQWPAAAQASMREAVARAARPLQRYRCAACGFESQRHFWQCPGCLGWDSFPPQRIEEL